MTKDEIDRFKDKEKKHEKEIMDVYSDYGIKDIIVLDYLGYAVNENSISKEFIERHLNKQSDSNILEVDKFYFEFNDDGMLCKCKYDGYNLDMFVADNSIGFFDIENYMNYSNKQRRSEDTMKRIINYQGYCYSHIDNDILCSNVSKRKFAYDVDENYPECFNYIAMAAYYKQCDVDQELFILSTDGEYEILSKTIQNGVQTTKIRAYHETFTFINGHSDITNVFNENEVGESSNSVISDGVQSKEGYVYVMVNPSLPDMVKIGMTTKDPNERVKELSSATGVPTPFILVFYKPFVDCYSTEQLIHSFLEKQGYRVSENREFFIMPTSTAIDVVQTCYDIEQESLKK